MKDSIQIGNITIEEDGPFFLIAGPCVIEDEETTSKVANFLKELSESMDVPVIFKTSYDKACAGPWIVDVQGSRLGSMPGLVPLRVYRLRSVLGPHQEA